MRQSRAILLTLGAAIAPVAASSGNATPQSGIDKSSQPAKETPVIHDAAVDVQLHLGFSPKPTEAPKPLFGRMMLPREDISYTLGPATCGFVPTNGNSFTCISTGQTCTPQNSFVGCCQPDASCSAIKTTCIDFARSSAGACNLPSDYHTLCCASSALPACYTWVISTSANTDKGDGLYTLFDCSPQAGRGTLLTIDPNFIVTPGPTTPSTNPSTPSPTVVSTPETTTSPPPTPTPSPPPKKSSNVGAIAGGAVGGVAALALIGAALFYFIRRNNNNGNNNNNQPPMGQQPPNNGTGYNSGVPQNYQYAPMSPQSGYEGGYNQQGWNGQYQQYPQQGQPFQGQYPQGYYPAAASVSPPPHTSPSPGIVKESETPTVNVQEQHTPATELPAVNPLGNESNRAELAS